MWFLKHFFKNLLVFALVISFVALLVWIFIKGLEWLVIVIVCLILIGIYTLFQGPDIDDYYFDDDGHIDLH